MTEEPADQTELQIKNLFHQTTRHFDILQGAKPSKRELRKATTTAKTSIEEQLKITEKRK